MSRETVGCERYHRARPSSTGARTHHHLKFAAESGRIEETGAYGEEEKEDTIKEEQGGGDVGESARSQDDTGRTKGERPTGGAGTVEPTSQTSVIFFLTAD